MTSSNDGVEVPPPTPVVQGKDQSTEDYYRDDMAVFEVRFFPRFAFCQSLTWLSG